MRYVKHDVQPRLRIRRLKASPRYGGEFEFMVQAYVGHEDFILTHLRSLVNRNPQVRWDMHVAQTDSVTGEVSTGHEALYSQTYPSDAMSEALADEFPLLNPLELEMAALDLREGAAVMEAKMREAFQTWYYQCGPVPTHANSSHLLPQWTEADMAALQATLPITELESL